MEEEEEEREKERRAAFHGAGFRLGDAEGPSVPIGNQRPLPAKPDTVCATVCLIPPTPCAFPLTSTPGPPIRMTSSSHY